MKMTFDEMCELYDKMENMEFSVDRWYPTKEDIEKFVLPNPEKYVKFLVWLTQNPHLCMTREEKNVEKIINRILNNTIDVIDDENNLGD